MKAASRRPERWNLTPEAFEALLQTLGPDRGAAARRYEALRRRLIKFFSWERCTFPEDRADEVINRFARRLAGGEPIANPESYCHGIARLVVREAQLEMARQQETARQLHVLPALAAGPSDGDRCLARCLKTLEPAQRDLLLGYYEGEKSQRIQNRARLSMKLGITLNTLRNRALRLREKMERCTRECLGEPARRDTPAIGRTNE
jgi:DNA-directed RNA polymerase specialized sigma24 family protein